MSKSVAKKTERSLAAELGVNRSLVGRKRRQGKSDEAIRSESQRQDKPASTDPADAESFAEAQRRKETALANLRELELAEKRTELISRKEVEDVAFRQARAERDALLNWVNAASPAIAFDLSVDAGAMHRLLEREARKFLEEQVAPTAN